MKKVTQEELKEIIAAHKLWLESSRKRGKRAHLLRADLRRAKLEGANLQEANLRYANLQGADLQGAVIPLSIRDCNFRWAKFTPDALPWLILHPRWVDWKGTVQIKEVMV